MSENGIYDNCRPNGSSQGWKWARILREERASITVRNGASCISACVFALIGETERSVGNEARVAIHRPPLGESGADASVAAMTDSLVLYAQQMDPPRAIVDAMMATPAHHQRFLTPRPIWRATGSR